MGIRSFFKNFLKQLNHVKTGVYSAKVTTGDTVSSLGAFPLFSLQADLEAPGESEHCLKRTWEKRSVCLSVRFFLLRDLKVFS